MIIHINQLYYQYMDRAEHDRLFSAMTEFSEAASQYQGRLSELEKTSLLWDIVINKKTKVTADCLSLEFFFPDHSPSKVIFPILSTSGITALSLFLSYMKALDTLKSLPPEIQP
jgi:hypothetical protein